MAAQKTKKENKEAKEAREEKEALMLDDLAPEMADIVLGKSGIFYEYRSWTQVVGNIVGSLKGSECYNSKTKEFYLSSDKHTSGILSQAEALISLTTLIENIHLTDDEKVNGKTEYIASKDKWIYDRIEDLTASIIKEIKKQTDDGRVYYHFDVSPFSSDFFNEKYSYLDSVTWVVSAFLGVFRVSKTDLCNTYDDHKQDIIDIVKYGLSYLNAAYIDGDEFNDIWDCGWNFTGGCKKTRPSLYFTYAVSECYVDLYDTFAEYIDYYNLQKREKVDGTKISRKARADSYLNFYKYAEENYYSLTGEAREHYNDNKGPKDTRYAAYLNDIRKVFKKTETDKDAKEAADETEYGAYAEEEIVATEDDYISYVIETVEGREKKDEIKKAEEFFLAINDNKPPYMYKDLFTDEEWVVLGMSKGKESEQKTVFDSFEYNCKKSARDVWKNVSDIFDENFLNNDLETIIDKTTIEKSSYSDALFNTLFAINIVIDGGLDEEIDFMITDADLRVTDADLSGELADKQKYLAAKQENIDKYDEMLQTIKAAFEKVRRFDRELQKKDREYIVDQCVLGFGENFTGELRDAAKDLRKQRIRTVSLVPLIVKTNNILNEYLIKFPQSDMTLFLEMILKNRTYAGKKEDGTTAYKWTWEREEYSITSTYYYIQALGFFYVYYGKYEKHFIPIESENHKQMQEIKDSYYTNLCKDGEIFKLRRENEKLASEKQDLQGRLGDVTQKYDELSANKSPLETAVTSFMMESLKPVMLGMLAQAMNDFSKKLADNNYETSKLGGDEKQFISSIKGLFASVIGGALRKIVNESVGEESEEFEEKCDELEKYVFADLNSLLKVYIRQIKNSDTNKSDYVTTNGYKGITPLLKK